MNKEKLLKEFSDYCNYEYTDVKRAIDNELYSGETDRKKTIYYSCQRCLGVAFFIQRLGVPFKEVDEIYMSFRTKVYAFI